MTCDKCMCVGNCNWNFN